MIRGANYNDKGEIRGANYNDKGHTEVGDIGWMKYSARLYKNTKIKKKTAYEVYLGVDRERNLEYLWRVK